MSYMLYIFSLNLTFQNLTSIKDRYTSQYSSHLTPYTITQKLLNQRANKMERAMAIQLFAYSFFIVIVLLFPPAMCGEKYVKYEQQDYS